MFLNNNSNIIYILLKLYLLTQQPSNNIWLELLHAISESSTKLEHSAALSQNGVLLIAMDSDHRRTMKNMNAQMHYKKN